MVKSSNEKKEMSNNLSLIDKNLLKKELNLCLQEPLDDIADIIIQNDNHFKLITKEKIRMTNNNIFKIENAGNVEKTKHVTEANGTVVNEIIDIKFTQKSLDNLNNSDISQYEDTLSLKDQSEIRQKTKSDVQFTNDLKRDLQSLLIMMAVTDVSACNNNDNNDKSILEMQSEKKNTCSKIFVKNENNGILNMLSNGSEMADLLKIEAVNTVFQKENKILRKYANKWIEFVKMRKKNINQHRLAKINNFFNRLEKRKMNHTTEPANKAKLQVRDYNTYQHRYKVQKHIIALQKAKLEQQNRLIEELKYNKIVNATQQSLSHMKEDVKQTYYEIDKNLKPKLKCLTNELKLRDIEDRSLFLHCLKVPQFLQRMEARAREREEKHAIIRERRKQMEEERIKLKQQAELAKAEMDKEEKAKRIKELREKRRKEKIENIRKKQNAERLRALCVMADLHYEKSLTIKYGIRPLKLLIEIKRNNIEKAEAHHQFQMKKNVLLNWLWYTEDMWYERNFKADEFYRTKLLKMAFNCLKKHHHEYLVKMQVARDYYDLYVTQYIFKKFREGIFVMKKEFCIKWNKAIIYYNSNILFKTLTCWRTLPALNALKREQDARKLRWREKVLQVVPDYVPPED